MMKVIAVNSSPRGTSSQTLRLVKALAEGAKENGAEVELVDLCKLKIEFCRACDVCHRTGTCIHHDDVAALRKKMLAADGIVLASPNYFRMVTAPMKALLDRLADMIHCQLLTGKYAAVVSTAGGPGCEEVPTYLSEILISLGAWVVGQAAASVSKGPDAMAQAEAKARRLGQDLVAAITEQRGYPEQQAQHERTAAYFRQLVELNRERWPYEFDLWLKTGVR